MRSKAALSLDNRHRLCKLLSMKKTLIGLAAISLLGSCTQTQGWFGSNKSTDSTQSIQSESSYKAKLTRDESITKENAYSDLFLDSATLENFIQQKHISADNADRMRAFYWVRNNEFAWLTSGGLTEQARSLWGLSASEEMKKDEPAAAIKTRMDSLLTNDSLIQHATDTLLRSDPSEAGLATATATKDSLLMGTELALTAQLVQLAAEKNSAITEDNFYLLVPRKKMDAIQLADSLLHKTGDSSLGQNNPQYTALKKSLQVYYSAANSGGWQTIPATKGLKKGAKSPAVVLLKKRLVKSGDYAVSDTSNVFNDSLVTAIKNVQEQYGFKPTGLLNDSLVNDLNVPAQERVQQILVNLNRALWMKPLTDSTQISVNIPSLQLVAYSDSGKAMQLPVIVGKEGAGTMAFSGKISEVVFSPYWNIPQSIVQNEIKPAMKADPNYLQKHHMEIVKQDDSLPRIRQLPGKDNALGQVKFLFPNSFDIYLHDTPNKEQFAQQNRALSHGCIRVAHPDSLAHFVLQNQSEWTPEKIKTAMNSGKEQTVDVKNPVPVSITYYTAWIDKNGRMNFRKDLYGYDKKTEAQLFGNGSAAM